MNEIPLQVSSRFFTHSPLLALVLLLFCSPVIAQPAPGFTLCVRPDRPACVSDVADTKSIDACEQEVKAYVARVLVYRNCLFAESARVVRESNDAIDRLRCRQLSGECQR